MLGTPEGLAIYQNGVRVNEPFGNIVLWDFIPVFAIETLQELPGSNPVFGLNALGGAFTLEMKNGFDAPGTTVEVNGGSFGRMRATAQEGVSFGVASVRRCDGRSSFICLDASDTKMPDRHPLNKTSSRSVRIYQGLKKSWPVWRAVLPRRGEEKSHRARPASIVDLHPSVTGRVWEIGGDLLHRLCRFLTAERAGPGSSRCASVCGEAQNDVRSRRTRC